MDKFILITDTCGQDHIVSVSHISRVSKRKDYSPVTREYYYKYCVEVAGALDGLSCAARIDITEQQFNKFKEDLLNYGEV